MISGYTFSTDKEKLDIDVIHGFLSQSYWAKNIPVEIVKRSIENSLCFGVYHLDKQIGFARVISDFASFGYLADVFILEEHRGKGLSKKLMEQIMAHPQLQGLRRFCLGTRDAHKLYEQFGFNVIKAPERFMEILHPPDFYTAKN
jgi:GNAT superfamily N-acetyltransferase